MLPLLFLNLALGADPTPIVIKHETKHVIVTGLDALALTEKAKANPTDADWQALCRVVVAGDTAEETATRTAILGTYSSSKDTVTFTPRFPFAPGTAYRVMVNPRVLTKAPDAKTVAKDFIIPRPDAPAAEILSISPTAEALPENTLRFYVYFSAPMTRGSATKNIVLTRNDGVVVDSPFLELDEELWSPDSTRLTLFVDPGRIKQGLKPREDLGAVLEAGHTYTLTLNTKWQDANGRDLKAKMTKKFKATKADNVPIDPAKWVIKTPMAITKNALMATLPKPLDAALLKRMVWVTNAKGTKIEGEIVLTKHETVWAFTPEKDWLPGSYSLVADTRLEDVCGNRVGSPFEIDVFNPVTKRLDVKTVSVPFMVK